MRYRKFEAEASVYGRTLTLTPNPTLTLALTPTPTLALTPTPTLT